MIERGVFTLGKDQSGRIVSVNMVNNELQGAIKEELASKIDTPKKAFEDMCKENSIYTIAIEDLNLFTSIPACHMAQNGFNETIVFHQDLTG